MKTILRLAFVVVLAFGWLPAAAQGEAPVGVPEPNPVADLAADENSEPYPLELVGQVFPPALGTDHDGANAMASSAVDAGTVKAADTFTMDTRYNERDYFYSGEAVKYIGIAANTTGAARIATLQWRLTGPCGVGKLWSGSSSGRRR
ncbi:MAG: hypothetical protein IPK16_14720 [Anaerolineales bacterium]|nr:hypothetical protein [Anaerolineales bacterium]